MRLSNSGLCAVENALQAVIESLVGEDSVEHVVRAVSLAHHAGAVGVLLRREVGRNEANSPEAAPHRREGGHL